MQPVKFQFIAKLIFKTSRFFYGDVRYKFENNKWYRYSVESNSFYSTNGGYYFKYLPYLHKDEVPYENY